MTRLPTAKFLKPGILALAISAVSANWAVAQEDASLESTVIYSADFFAEYSPVSINDMVNRIPGIGLALQGGGGGRGLGSGAGEILINGQRIAGKNNGGRSQLSRIPADQLEHIEIIRGSSEELGVRGGGQVVNIVLLDSPSRTSISAEVNADYLHDGTVDPGAKASISGQKGDFYYLYHIEAEPRYGNDYSREVGFSPDYELQETRHEVNIREQKEYQTSMNLGYQFDNSSVQLNALYGVTNPVTDTERTIVDYLDSSITRIREERESERDNWEIGGDYEYRFNNGSRYNFLFIVNDRNFESIRERFEILGAEENKDLFLFNSSRDQERIVRTAYNWNLNDNQGIEFGVEGAQTIRDSDLRQGTDSGTGLPSAAVGGLIPRDISNAKSSVEEQRLEFFSVHNWQLNDRMSLESSLVYETSTISQSGDVSNERDFSFLRPKVEYRFDLTPSLQFRATIKKDVSQLSFSDFSATIDSSDDDSNTQAGNPDIVQEQSWGYDLNLEYRLPNDIGVINSQFFYRDIQDVIDRVDVSTGPDNLQSARGNIGDGKRYGMNLDASTRLSFLNMPNILLTTALNIWDSEVNDPFLNEKRRMRNNSRGSASIQLRHDLTDYNLSYGFDYYYPFQGGSGKQQIDITDIENYTNEPSLSTFIEKKAFGDFTFRLETQNTLDSENCRTRTRFIGATIDGIVEEIENNCSGSGMKLALKIRTTF